MNSFAAWFSLFLTVASTTALIGDWLRPDLVGRSLLPDRFPADLALQLRQVRQELIRMYGVEATLGDYEVQPESPLAGRSIRDGRWANEVGLPLTAILFPAILLGLRIFWNL